MYLEYLCPCHIHYTLPCPPSIINMHHNRLGSTVPFIATLAHDTHHCATLIFDTFLGTTSLFRAWKLKSIVLVWNYRVELWRHIKHTMVCFKCASFMATLIQGLHMDQTHCFSNVVVSCMSDTRVSFADMYEHVFSGQDSASHRPNFGECSCRVYSRFGAHAVHIAPYFRFCAKVNYNMTKSTNYSSMHCSAPSNS